jgi:hypothetical protein
MSLYELQGSCYIAVAAQQLQLSYLELLALLVKGSELF